MNVGGRPRLPEVLCRGIIGGASSNRRLPGEKPRRQELEASEMLQMPQEMKAAAKDFGPHQLQEYWATMRGRWPDLGKKRLKQIRDKEEEWKARVAKLEIGKRPGAAGLRRQGSRQALSSKDKLSKGVRQEGAGANFKF